MRRSLSIGDLRISALPDGAADLGGWPVPADAPPAPPVDWAAYHERFPDGFHGPNHTWRIHNNLFLVEGPDGRVLVDCGVGVGPYPWYANLRGQAMHALGAAGLLPRDIADSSLVVKRVESTRSMARDPARAAAARCILSATMASSS